jgi:hypothetical protein
MSTYYRFHCPVCSESGGWFSRQAWGWGNADIIYTFKFIMFHLQNCDADSLEIVSEHDDLYDAIPSPNSFVERTEGIFPRSDDWENVCWSEDWKIAEKRWAINFKDTGGSHGMVGRDNQRR